ncbi:hypothetical protein JW979_06730, partial [bacterium]|nr:hypothetical protein [candidate division CSSED10-310 bacterium]
PTPTYTLPPWIPPTRTPTPGGPLTPTPTPPLDRPSITIYTNASLYHSKDSFRLAVTIVNPIQSMFVMEYIILDYQYHYWFWPDWTETINGKFLILPGQTRISDETILEFEWPDIQTALYDVTFWAALTEPNGYNVVGDFGMCMFDFEP